MHQRLNRLQGCEYRCTLSSPFWFFVNVARVGDLIDKYGKYGKYGTHSAGGASTWWKTSNSAVFHRRRQICQVAKAGIGLYPVTRSELGAEAAAEVAHALRLLQERGDRHAAFWACPPCDAAFPSSVEFNEHVYAFHEEAVYSDEDHGRYLICSHCHQEVGCEPIRLSHRQQVVLLIT